MKAWVIPYASRLLRDREKDPTNCRSFKLELLSVFKLRAHNNPLAYLGALKQRCLARLATFKYNIFPAWMQHQKC